MKIKLLILVFITTVWFNTQLSLAQDVFPKSDAIWVIHLYEYADRPGKQYIYGLSGDTIVNNLTYQKLYLLNDSTLNIDHEDIYVAGIRQIDKQVWILPTNKKDGSKFDEFLMYDFGKNVGEEIFFTNRPYIGRWQKPTFEDISSSSRDEFSVTVFDIQETALKKSYYIGNYLDYDDKWIEGIGSCSGLYFLPLIHINGVGGPIGAQLVCMKENNRIKYLQEDCFSCFNSSPITSIIPEYPPNTISVIYSRLEREVNIELNQEVEVCTFNLVAIDGKKVLTKILLNKHMSINLENISDGIYIYNIIGKNFNKKGKFNIK